MDADADPVLADRLLEGLTPAQLEAVRVEGGPVCILAGAGSGKTRVLTRRIAYRAATGSADPRHVLAVTFTRRAAGELTSRLAHLGIRHQVAAGTFHSLAYAQLRHRWADRGELPPTLIDRKGRILAPLIREATTSGARMVELATEIEWAKARNVTPTSYQEHAGAAGRRPALPLAVVASLFGRYEDEKRRRGVIDFDDLLLLCAIALETDDAFAARQRWRFRHLFVDELQDLNPVQHRLLEAWRGTGTDLCVVGDPNQAIYSWNGADPGFLTSFAERFPTAVIVRLDDNFRSSPQILSAAGAVLGRPAPAAVGGDGPAPTVRSWPTDLAEARGIARAVRDRHGPGRPWSEQAVLARTHAQAVLVAEALREGGIPHRLRGARSLLDEPDVVAAVAELRGRQRTVAFAAALPDLEVAARAVGSDTDGLAALVALGHEFLALDPGGGTDAFLAWLHATVRADLVPGTADAVEIATFHAAKGLEWPIVHLAGLEDGLVPIARATTQAARDEERRLLYVAMTRARHELHCSWARRRRFGDREADRSPSPFLAAIEATAPGTPPPSEDPVWRERLAAERSRLAATPGPAPAPILGAGTGDAPAAVLDALRSWREAVARASGVDVSAIVHDRVLAEVAHRRPRSHTQLLELPGLGPVKARRYGDALLAAVAEHAGS